MTRILLDTNILLRCVSRRSPYAHIIDKLFESMFELCVTTDILLEHEEKVTSIFSRETAEFLIGAFMLLPNVKKVDIHFHLNSISQDFDDNKFADCAFAANSHFIVSDYTHFNELNAVGFPPTQGNTFGGVYQNSFLKSSTAYPKIKNLSRSNQK